MTTLIASTMILLCSIITQSAANSNMVSISHRSTTKNGISKNYSSGLNVVKSSSQTNSYGEYIDANDNSEEEYVTNFYRQKREEKRELAAGKMSGDPSGEREADDHSLDHYFDHDTIVMQNDNNVNVGNRKRDFFRRRNNRGGGGNSYDGEATKKKPAAFLPKTKQHARVASSVRGGGSITQQVRKQQKSSINGSGNGRSQQYHHSRKNQQRHSSHQPPSSSSSAAFAPKHSRHSHHPHYQRRDNTHEVTSMDEFNSDHHDIDALAEDTEYEEEEDYSNNEQDDNDRSTPIHQSGLLRVPCRLQLNSNEDGRQHSSSSTTKSTPIAAYVDTGAQVTVISAAAARKVGILHLMDRRYAGRATGVGHCKVLGRIPAGCVHFMLGRKDDTNNEAEEYDDENDEYEEEDRSIIQMNGPALTVLEGTVTEGVDMLLGLDVLQDWEATIQMGGRARKSSITVRKRGVEEPVVLPFLVGGLSEGIKERRRSGGTTTRHGQQGSSSMRQQQQQQHTAAKTTRYHSRRHHHQRHIQQQHDDIPKEEDDEDDFSPVSSDIESDLDILDQSEFTHEFPDEGRRRVKQCSEKIVHDIEREDELLGVRHYSHHHDRRSKEEESKEEESDDDDEFLQDSSDEEEVEEENFDMSGL